MKTSGSHLCFLQMMWFCWCLQVMTFIVHWDGSWPSAHSSQLEMGESFVKVENELLPQVKQLQYLCSRSFLFRKRNFYHKFGALERGFQFTIQQHGRWNCLALTITFSSSKYIRGQLYLNPVQLKVRCLMTPPHTSILFSLSHGRTAQRETSGT